MESLASDLASDIQMSGPAGSQGQKCRQDADSPMEGPTAAQVEPNAVKKAHTKPSKGKHSQKKEKRASD